MKHNFKKIYPVIVLMAFTLAFSSCYKNVADAPYPSEAVYMPAATNGFYTVNSVAVPGQTYRYTVDPTAAKLSIPLAAYRSGLNSDGNITLSVAAKTDTVNTLITSGALTNTLLLPASAYSVPSSVIIPGGSDLGQFALSIDLNFLLSNTTQTYAIAVGINSTTVPTTSKNVTVVIINPAFLIPTANFTSALDSKIAKQYNFTNTSSNSVSYSWNFGDGSTVVTDKSPSHVFASGTYTITLTSTGAAGTINPAVKTAVIVVP